MEQMNSPAPRTPLLLEVEFKKNYARENSMGTLKNISLTGAFMEFNGLDLPIREKLVLTLTVCGRERKLQARVVWKNNTGAGIKFLPLNNRDVQIVDDLIYFVETKRIGHRDLFDGIVKKVA